MPTRSRSRKNLRTLSASPWSSRVALTGTTKPQDGIVTAMDSKNRQWVVLRDSMGQPSFGLMYTLRRLKRDWRPALPLVTSSSAEYPAFAIAPDDVKVVVWQQPVNGVKRIGYMEFRTTPGEFIHLPNEKRLLDAYPDVTVGADGTRHVVWSRAGKIVHGTSSNGIDWNIAPVTRDTVNVFPSVAIDDAAGVIHLVYVKTPGNAIQYQRRALNAGEWETRRTLGSGKDPNVVARNGKVLVSWGNSDNNRQMAFRVFENDAWGQTIYSGHAFPGYRPHGAIDSRGNAHLIWMQSTDNRNAYSIYYSDSNNGQWSAPQPFETGARFCEANDLVVDRNDKLHTVYQEMLNNTFIAYSTDRALV